MPPHPMHCLAYTLLVVPPLLLTIYLLAAFPSPPDSLYLHPSLASLPKSCKSWEIYPEDYYPGGAYVDFPYGRVRYWLMGPATGAKIVLIHGLSVPSLIWKDIAPELSTRGYRVLLYDLYGRGYSDAPETRYDSRLYSTQLALLMQHIGWDQAVVVGVSMGGAVASSFPANFPHLVQDKVVLISSTGIIERSSAYAKIYVFSDCPERYFKYASAEICSTSHGYFFGLVPLLVPDEFQIVRIQSAHLPGFDAAIGSSLRDGPIRGLHSAFQLPSFNGRKVLIIHGTKDTAVSFKYASQIAALLPPGAQHELVTVPDGGHDLTISHPALVLEALQKFLSPS